MRRCFFPVLLLALCWATGSALSAAEPRVLKVLPHLLDQEGRHTLSPSLFDRDAYQAWLRARPERQSGIRYDVHWRPESTGEFQLKLEVLGRVEERQVKRRTIENKVTTSRAGARWSAIEFSGEEYQKFGPVVAWRVSVWQGDQMVAKYQSFLWE